MERKEAIRSAYRLTGSCQKPGRKPRAPLTAYTQIST